MFTLTILGNNSALPAYGRNPTSQFLQTDQFGILIDCGEGTQSQLNRYKVKPGKITHIVISHLHGDHYFGLIGLLTSMSLLNRKQELHLYGPKTLSDIINIQLTASESELNYPLHFHPLTNEEVIMESNTLRISCFRVYHRIECWGFHFSEVRKPRSVIQQRAHAYDIPSDFYDKLQLGENYINAKGTIIPNEEVTMANLPAKTYAFCADTVFDERLTKKIHRVDLLYHETTYLNADHEKAGLRFHSTTHQAATLAKEAEVKQLLIGHFSSKYETLVPFLEEAKEIFSNTVLAIEGTCIKI